MARYGLREMAKQDQYSEHDLELISIIDTAFECARDAVDAYITRYSESGDIGKVWVSLKPISSKVGQILLKKYNAEKGKRCVIVRNPGNAGSCVMSQQEGALAFASILIEKLDSRVAVHKSIDCM